MMLNQAQSASTPAPQAVPELGHLKVAAERIAQANYNLSTFITRFFGPVPESGAATGKGEAIACYRNDLTAVFDEISQLENLVNGLQNIG